MFDKFHAAVIRPLVVRWLQTSEFSWRSLPVPTGSPWARAAGHDPDRVLLLGSGIAVGYGASTHDLALAGQLARELSEHSGRGAEVEVVVAEDMPLETAIDTLDGQRLRSVDAVVITPGGVESLLLLPTSAWRREMETLLDHVHQLAPASLHIFIVAVPPLPKIVRVPWILARISCASVMLLNRELRRICVARPYATYVPFAPGELAGRTGTGSTYRRWARLIAPALIARLDRQDDRITR